MAHKSLYRVFRPDTFGDVYGQPHITEILKKQVQGGEVSHAYLFFGPRGTGKTSTAKIFANAINCLNPKDGNPCHECEVCKSVADGAYVDIIEIDAASNNSVDNIRDIREKVSLLPAMGKYKVYIIDEVHMLSSGAFNALLKTLEEPPPHAVFILATTEARKLPATILSRCQRYDFKRISEKDILARLAEVAEKTGIKYDEDALQAIAKAAEGAMRDALSMLDQCIAGKEMLTVQDVYTTIGIAESESLEALVDDVLSENPQKALEHLNAMLMDGAEPQNIIRDIITKLSEKLAENASDSYKCANILRAVEVFIGVQNTLRYSRTPAAVLMAAVTRAAVNTTDVDTSDFELRIKKLEQRVEKLSQKVASGGGNMPVQEPRLQKEPEMQEALPELQKPTEIPVVTAQEKPDGMSPEGSAKPQPDAGVALQKMKELIGGPFPLLRPALDAIRRIEVLPGRVHAYVAGEDLPLAEILLNPAHENEVDSAMQEIFTEKKALYIMEDKADVSKEGPSAEEVLFDAFGKENVIIQDKQ